MPTTRPTPRSQGRRRSGFAGKKIDALNAGAGPAERFAGLGVSVGFAEANPAGRRLPDGPLSACGASPRAAQANSRPTSPGWGRSWVRKPSSCRGCTVYSSGVTEAAKAVGLLTTASKAPQGFRVSQAQAVDALTSLMTGYTGELNRAAEASDLLFAIEKQGKTTVGEVIRSSANWPASRSRRASARTKWARSSPR